MFWTGSDSSPMPRVATKLRRGISESGKELLCVLFMRTIYIKFTPISQDCEFCLSTSRLVFAYLYGVRRNDTIVSYDTLICELSGGKQVGWPAPKICKEGAYNK